MVRASLRGWQYAVDHPEEAADIVLKYDKSGVQTREHQLSMMNEIAKLVLLPVRPLGFTDRDSVRRTIDTLARLWGDRRAGAAGAGVYQRYLGESDQGWTVGAILRACRAFRMT